MYTTATQSRKQAQDSRLDKVNERLQEIFATMKSLGTPTVENVDSLIRRVEAISSELELGRVFDSLSGILQDLSFGSVRQWKGRHPSAKALAFFPVYAPMEIIHAAGMLPVGLARARQSVELQHADSPGGSPVCSIVKTTLEMAMKGHLKVFDAFLFSSVCDPAQNLCSVFKRTFPKAYVDSINLPHDCASLEVGVSSLNDEYRRILLEFDRLGGTHISDADLQKSIGLYNLERSLLRRLYAIRAEAPYLLKAWESILITSAGHLVPVEEYIPILQGVLGQLERRSHEPRDSVRVIVEGSFCEQPSLEIIRLLEAAGCAIVEDDFAVAQRYFETDVSSSDDPVRALAESYMENAMTATRRGGPGPRWKELAEKINRTGADAVVMLVTTSCPAAFLDYVLFKRKLAELGMPLLSLARTPSGRLSLLTDSDFLSLMKDSKSKHGLCLINVEGPESNGSRESAA